MMNNYPTFSLNQITHGAAEGLERFTHEHCLTHPGTQLRHYTSLEGGYNIINSGVLRAFSNNSMNDYRDGVELLSTFKTVCHDHILYKYFKDNHRPKNGSFEFFQSSDYIIKNIDFGSLYLIGRRDYDIEFVKFLDYICHFISDQPFFGTVELKGGVRNSYVLSFVEDEPQGYGFPHSRETLEFWRSYAQDGSGLSLCFSKDAFQVGSKVQDNSNGRFGNIYKCIYPENSDIIKFCSDLIYIISNDFSKGINDRDLYIKNLLREIVKLSSIIKHNIFKDEKEIRVVFFDRVCDEESMENIIFSPKAMRRYINYNFNREFITEVVAGPCVSNQSAAELARYLNHMIKKDILKHHLLSGIFRKSTVPYVGK